MIESEDEIRFQLSAPIKDPQVAAFRSRAPMLNDLAISHRLSLHAGRSKYGLPDDFAFAIKSVESVVHAGDEVEGYHVSLRFEITSKRRDTITGLRSTLETRAGAKTRVTNTSFSVMPPALANFVRRGRNYLDFADVKIGRDQSQLSTIGDNHFRYYPAEADRLSDGRRVDHVPALTLIDIALSVNAMINEGDISSNISAEFLNYCDPRQAFDIVEKKDQSALEFVQDGQAVAVMVFSPQSQSSCVFCG